MRYIFISTSIFVLIFAVGCSSIRTKKVPHPPSYSLAETCTNSENAPCWNELRRQADEIEGTRYYLPRPYVAVKQRFPVDGGTYLVEARVEGDRLMAVDGIPEALGAFFPGKDLGGLSQLKKEVTPAFSTIPLAASEDSPTDRGSKGFVENSENGQEDSEESKEDESDEETEIPDSRATTSGDPSTDPLIKVSELFDILLLPDFSQQYAIQVRSGLFKASADIGLENGWMVEKINTEIDNSQLGEFVLSSTEKVVDATLGKFFPQFKAVETAEKQPSANEDEVRQEAEQREGMGQPMFVRIDYVQLATPGLHPVIKVEEQACGTRTYGPQACWPRVEWRTLDRLVMTLVGLKD